MSARKFDCLTVCEWQDSGAGERRPFFREVGGWGWGTLIVGAENILNVGTKRVTHGQRDKQTHSPEQPFRRLRVLRHV